MSDIGIRGPIPPFVSHPQKQPEKPTLPAMQYAVLNGLAKVERVALAPTQTNAEAAMQYGVLSAMLDAVKDTQRLKH